MPNFPIKYNVRAEVDGRVDLVPVVAEGDAEAEKKAQAIIGPEGRILSTHLAEDPRVALRRWLRRAKERLRF